MIHAEGYTQIPAPAIIRYSYRYKADTLNYEAAINARFQNLLQLNSFFCGLSRLHSRRVLSEQFQQNFLGMRVFLPFEQFCGYFSQ